MKMYLISDVIPASNNQLYFRLPGGQLLNDPLYHVRFQEVESNKKHESLEAHEAERATDAWS